MVVSVQNDNDGLIETMRATCPLETPAELEARYLRASTPADRIDALLGLASAQSLYSNGPLPELEQCTALALDSTDMVERLVAIRASAMLPTATAHALLTGRADPDNPGLSEWYAHYADQNDRSA